MRKHHILQIPLHIIERTDIAIGSNLTYIELSSDKNDGNPLN
jgi:hypothetical protein